MPRIKTKPCTILPARHSKRLMKGPTTVAGRIPELVQPTPEQLLRRADALGIDIKLQVDPETGRLVWDATHDLTAAVDVLAVYRATHVISSRQESAGRLYAMGRRATFGTVFPIGTVLARMVATSLPQGLEQAAQFARWESLTDEDREQRRAELEDAYRAADRRLLRRCGQPVRSVVRVVCLDGDRIPARCERLLRYGLEKLARWWALEDEDD